MLRAPWDLPPPCLSAALAPSPTGRLHLGHARSFLLAWWHARAGHGRVLLRIDDLDGPRCRPEFSAGILEDLEWLGLDWDGSVAHQSEHRDAYARSLSKLENSGRLYPCVCTRSEIRAAQSAPQEGVSEVRYPGTCRDRYGSAHEAERTSGRTAGLRLRVPTEPVRFDDGFAGPQEHDVAGATGDFLVARRDGTTAYQLAVVVDDAQGDVTHVLRGDDLLASAARQALLLDALDLARPAWVHVPLVCDEDDARLAKRSDALSLAALRGAGVDPRAVVGWIASTCGLGDVPRTTPRELVDAFELARVPRERVRAPADIVQHLLARR